jgi:predicted Ser/Thr protein kinase
VEAVNVVRVLKRDALGWVELVEREGQLYVRRVACGGRLPLSRSLARFLLARERRALEALQGLAGVPRLEHGADLAALPLEPGAPRGAVLVRSFVAGEPLHRAEALPEDFFERLAELVGELHRRGVCHNDLHKEQNVVVGADGYPHLIDFQLASCHAGRGRLFASRAHDDLRHVAKHRRRYLRAGRGPQPGEPARPPRTALAALWRRGVKPLYEMVIRAVPAWRDGEERRASAGPWPRRTAAVGPRRAAGEGDGGRH